ncbi:MAG TPA: CBS domain-containing protein [Acidimicrobiales bacterium]|nr:CBS domain-containing protein [Acidimicrobiales bacterium]
MARRPQHESTQFRTRLDQRHRRLTTTRAVRDAIVSLAGLINQPIRHQGGEEIGRLIDLVARFAGDQAYPPITGLVVRVGRRQVFLDASLVATLTNTGIVLRSARIDLRDFERRDGELLLARDVLDHQLVDVDGVQVIRAADLYLAPAQGRIRLVGVDVSAQSLLRRLGPARLRARPTPERVIDWAAIQPFGSPGVSVRLRTSHEGLHRLRPGELADLLEDLDRGEQLELLEALDPHEAADALEEMDPEELESLLRGVEPHRAASLLESMETDEAVEALRDLDDRERHEVLEHMSSQRASELLGLLAYEEDSAGGIMTTALAIAGLEDTVEAVRVQLRDLVEHRGEIDGVVVVDAEGVLVDDLPLFDIAVADPLSTVADLVRDERPITVGPDEAIREVAAQLTEARRSSVLVVSDGRPIGRILADDVVDALLPERGRVHFPRFLQ